jgi:hypothetical protein
MKMRAVLLFSTLGVCLCMGHAQTGASYDALIQQGKTELQAGNSAQALASGQQAVQLDAARWEAYALAGGALMNLKRYEEAADALSESIKHTGKTGRPPRPPQTMRACRSRCNSDSPTARRSTPTRRHLPGRSRPLENHRDQH